MLVKDQQLKGGLMGNYTAIVGGRGPYDLITIPQEPVSFPAFGRFVHTTSAGPIEEVVAEIAGSSPLCRLVTVIV